MSGGSYDYLYGRVEEAAHQIARLPDVSRERAKVGGEYVQIPPEMAAEYLALRAAFAEHLQLVAKAMHEIEWHDSADTGAQDCLEALRAVLKPGQVIGAALGVAELAGEQLLASVRVVRIIQEQKP